MFSRSICVSFFVCVCDWVIFHCVCVRATSSSPIHLSIGSLLPCLGYYKQRCSEHQGVRGCSDCRLHFFQTCTPEWWLLVLWGPSTLLSTGAAQFAPLPAVRQAPLCSPLQPWPARLWLRLQVGWPPCPCSPAPLLPPPSRWTRELAPRCAGRSSPGVASLLCEPGCPSGRTRVPSSVPSPGQPAPPWLGPLPGACRPSAACLPWGLPCVALAVCDLSLTGAPGWRPGPQPTPRPTQPSLCRASPRSCGRDSQSPTSNSGSRLSDPLTDPPKSHYSEWPHPLLSPHCCSGLCKAPWLYGHLEVYFCPFKFELTFWLWPKIKAKCSKSSNLHVTLKTLPPHKGFHWEPYLLPY